VPDHGPSLDELIDRVDQRVAQSMAEMPDTSGISPGRLRLMALTPERDLSGIGAREQRIVEAIGEQESALGDALAERYLTAYARWWPTSSGRRSALGRARARRRGENSRTSTRRARTPSLVPMPSCNSSPTRRRSLARSGQVREAEPGTASRRGSAVDDYAVVGCGVVDVHRDEPFVEGDAKTASDLAATGGVVAGWRIPRISPRRS
jgi:hypothetical protein